MPFQKCEAHMKLIPMRPKEPKRYRPEIIKISPRFAANSSTGAYGTILVIAAIIFMCLILITERIIK